MQFELKRPTKLNQFVSISTLARFQEPYNLHRDSGCTRRSATCQQVSAHCPNERERVDAGVIKKVFIFLKQDSVAEGGCDFVGFDVHSPLVIPAKEGVNNRTV